MQRWFLSLATAVTLILVSLIPANAACVAPKELGVFRGGTWSGETLLFFEQADGTINIFHTLQCSYVEVKRSGSVQQDAPSAASPRDTQQSSGSVDA